MKKVIFLLLLFIGLPLISQEKTKVRITQQGYGETHGLRVSFNNSIVDFNPEGDVLFEKEMEITEPVYGIVITPKGRYTGFWLEPGKGEVTIIKKGFPRSTQVADSKTHKAYQSVKFAKSKQALMRDYLTYKDNLGALYYLNNSFPFTKLEASELQKLYDATNEKNHSRLAKLKAFLVTRDIPTVKVNSNIYDFTGQDKDGKNFSTVDYRGQYLLIDFAATGCGPCWAGYPDLIEETAKYDNLKVLTFNEDNAIEGWQGIATSKGIELEWPVLWTGANKKEIFEIYEIKGWPNFFLISPEGKVIDQWMGSGGSRLKSAMKKVAK